MSFSKGAKTYSEQLEILKGRGLLVADPAFAEHCLAHCNYYRLSAYRFTLTEQGDPDKFLPGVDFHDLWNLYHFDRTLRSLVSEGLKRIEISVRARWAYVLAHKHGPLSYEDPSIFRDAVRHSKALGKFDEEHDRSDEVFVPHFQKKHGLARPPVWAACELMSFGLLSRFYENLRSQADRKEIAATYDIAPDSLESLLKHGAYLRNICAHHARLWNRSFTITLSLPNNPTTLQKSYHFVSPTKPGQSASPRLIHNSLVVLLHMISKIEPQSHWPQRLKSHIRTIPLTQLGHMGFPADWEVRPVWRNIA